MIRVWRATQVRAGIVAGVTAASLLVPAICRLHGAPAEEDDEEDEDSFRVYSTLSRIHEDHDRGH